MAADITTEKRCVECDRKVTWDKWFCPSCGGRLLTAKHERPKVAKGQNNVLAIMNDRGEAITLDLPPNERVTVGKGEIKRIPVANDEDILIRIRADGTIMVGAKMYAES